MICDLMKYLFQFLRILVFCLLGELLHFYVPLPIPASIYGLVLLLLALKAGIVKLHQVKETANFLTGIFTLLFISGAAGVMELWDLLEANWLPLLIALVPVTFLVFGVSGRVTQWIAGRKRHA